MSKRGTRILESVRKAVPVARSLLPALHKLGLGGEEVGSELHNAAFSGVVERLRREVRRLQRRSGIRPGVELTPRQRASMGLAGGAPGLDDRDKNGNTALVVASQQGNVAAVAFLLEEGADAEVKNRKGRTALLEAAANGHVEVVRLLLNASVDLNVFGYDRMGAMELASRNQHWNVVQVLRGEEREVMAPTWQDQERQRSRDDLKSQQELAEQRERDRENRNDQEQQPSEYDNMPLVQRDESKKDDDEQPGPSDPYADPYWGNPGGFKGGGRYNDDPGSPRLPSER